MNKYKTFIRSCVNWQQFARSRRITDCTGLTLEEARARCKWYNDNRSTRQIRRGTMMEFTQE